MTIQSRITMASIMAMVLLAIVLLFAGHLAQDAAEQRYEEASLNGKRVLWEQMVRFNVEQMSHYTNSMMRDRKLLKGLKTKNHETVKGQAITTHNTLHLEGAIDRLQVVSLDGEYLMSAPKEFSGKTRKSLIKKVAKEKKQAHGIERDDDGRLHAVLAFPLFYRGKPKGIGIYTRDLQQIIDDFQKEEVGEIFVLDEAGNVLLGGINNLLEVPHIPDLEKQANKMVVDRVGGGYQVASTMTLRNQDEEALATLVSIQDKTDSYSVQATATYTSLGVVFLAIIGSTLGLLWYFKKLFSPLSYAVSAISEIADGNLKCEIHKSQTNDETGILTRSLETMVNELQVLIGNISDSTDELSEAATQLANDMDESSRAIDHQSDETEIVAAAVHEMTANIQGVANNASEAAQAANEADRESTLVKKEVEGSIDSVIELNEEIEQATRVITDLSQASEKIGTVLEVIQSIAEQTNLLALNAAIEAARAGEQGRGFSVVADEVRTLATRTQQSTQEIRSMIVNLQTGVKEAVEVIGSSQENVTLTIRQTENAKGSLNIIVKHIEQIREMNAQTAEAVAEQSAMATSVDSNITKIKEFAAKVEEVSQRSLDSSLKVAELGVRLKSAVDGFSV